MSKLVGIAEDPNPALQVGKLHGACRPGESIDVINSEKPIERDLGEVDYLDTPVKSVNDKKDYRVIRLPNGLTALLISDIQSISNDQNHTDECTQEQESRLDVREEDDKIGGDLNKGDTDFQEKGCLRNEEKMAACGLCVGVGSFSDPLEIPGMAHFLEHMVFMGSEKYPQENDFDAFVKKRGGSFDASTDCEHTTFHFEIQEKHLFDTLERFAQFFVSPLMKRDAMSREREAFDSEFKLAVTSDSSRETQLPLYNFAQPGHPATKYIWGNLVTLRDNVTDDKLYEELHKFRQRHYSAHRITLAIQGRLHMDTLEQYVKDCFSTVPNNGLPPDDFTQFEGIQSFDTPNFRRLYKIKPVADFCKLELTWTMPSLHHLYKSKPHHYVSWIIGHEGKGSLTSYLRKKLWCLHLSGGNVGGDFAYSSMYGLFTLSIVLTEDGHEHLEEVLNAVFSYVSFMRRSGPEKRIYDEIQQISECNFRFADEISAARYVSNLAREMHFYPPSDYITGNCLYSEYNPVEIQACMDALTPNGANIILYNKKFNDAEFDKVEPWFKTKYTDMEIPNDWIEHWRKIEPFPDFHLPEPNIFITDDFSLVPLPEDVPKYPTKIHSDSMSEIWFRPDPKFRNPESYMYYYFISPLALTSPENAVLMGLLVTVLRQLLDEELYPAKAAGLGCYIYAEDKGIFVTVTGFNQKLPFLLSTVMRNIADCSNSVTQDLFEVMKADELKGYYNTFLEPQYLEYDLRLSMQMQVHWTAVDKYAAISNVEFHQFQRFAKQFVDHIYMKCLLQGNMTKEDVVRNAQNCIDILKCGSILPNTLPRLRVTQIPIGSRCCRVKNFNKVDSNSVVTNYYQSGIGNIKISVIIELLIMLMEEPLFYQLRTQEQLGYSVLCEMQNTFFILGCSITVCTQADKFTTEQIDERIDKFLESFLETLQKNISEKELSIVKVALVERKQCAPLGICEEINQNWAEIESGEYMFDRRDEEINAINETKIEDLRDWMEKHLLDRTNLRKLSIQIVGKSQEKDKIGNESSEKSETVTNSCVDEIIVPRDNSQEYNNDVKLSLEYLTDMPNEKTVRSSTYYITDIADFKKSLRVYPPNCTAT